MGSSISISFMFFLWWAKVKASIILDSRTMEADAACSFGCISLSIVLLLGSALYHGSKKLWWVDPVFSLLLAALILWEGAQMMRAAMKEDFDGCGCTHEASWASKYLRKKMMTAGGTLKEAIMRANALTSDKTYSQSGGYPYSEACVKLCECFPCNIQCCPADFEEARVPSTAAAVAAKCARSCCSKANPEPAADAVTTSACTKGCCDAPAADAAVTTSACTKGCCDAPAAVAAVTTSACTKGCCDASVQFAPKSWPPAADAATTTSACTKGCCDAPAGTDDGASTVVLDVDYMDCASDAAHCTKSLCERAGVVSVTVSGDADSKQVTIVYDAAVDEIGFVASVAGAAAAAAADVAGYLELLSGTAGDAGAGAEVTGAEVVLTMDPSMEMEVEEVD